MTHPEMDELYELYALGALELPEASEIDQHIADHCEYCLSQIQSAIQATALLSGLEHAVEPPADVRRRLMASFVRAKQPSRWSFAVPLLAAACVLLGVFGIWSAVQLAETRHELQRAAGERAQLREALKVLSTAQPTLVQFGKEGKSARGSVFFNRSGGFVMSGSNMPQIASDKTFELWVITKGGKPIPAGIFRGSPADDRFVHVYQEPLDVSQVAALAVTVEPLQGSLAPTSKPFLVVPIS